MLREQFYNKLLNDEEKERLKIIYTTRESPNQGISVSRRIDAINREYIAKVLQGDPSIQPIIDRFAKKSMQFIPANVEEYEGASGLLEGVVWGWQQRLQEMRKGDGGIKF